MTRSEIPTLPNEILERIVRNNIEADPETAFKTALAFRKQMCALSQQGKYPSIYRSIIPRMPYEGRHCELSLAIQDASYRGLVCLLEWWKLHGMSAELLDEYRYGSVLFTINVKALQWWEDAKFKFRETEIQAAIASSKGDVEALNSWSTSRFDFIYDEEAIDCASREGKTESLDW